MYCKSKTLGNFTDKKLNKYHILLKEKIFPFLSVNFHILPNIITDYAFFV